MEQSKLITSKSFFDVNPVIIGIDNRHTFIVQFANNNILPITEDSAVNLLRLLEIDYHTFYKEIEEMLGIYDSLVGKVKTAENSFPFNIIVKAALTSERDYWIELSIPWLKEIGKSDFLEEIKDVLKNKAVSQRIRHLLLKL